MRAISLVLVPGEMRMVTCPSFFAPPHDARNKTINRETETSAAKDAWRNIDEADFRRDAFMMMRIIKLNNTLFAKV
jgi:hypothetical protein